MWKNMRAAPDAAHRLIAVIPAGRGWARCHVVPSDTANEMARHIVRGYSARKTKVRAYIYDEKAEQVAAY